MGASGGTKQTSTSEPWKPLQPLLQNYIGQVGNQLNGPPEVYGGQRVAGLGNMSMGGVNSLYNSGGQNQVTAASAPMLAATARGDNLNGNPYFNGLVDRQSGKLADHINSIFSGSGRYGSVAHQGALADEVGNFRNQAMSDNYGRERSNQMQAAGMSSQFENIDHQNAADRLAAGGIVDQNKQAMLDAQRQKWLEGQKSTQLGQSLGLFGNLMGAGGTQTQTTPGQKPGFGQIAGLGLTLAGTAMGMPWLGAAAGGLAGLGGGTNASPMMFGGPR